MKARAVKQKEKRGGRRIGAGRPPKPENILVTVSLRRDTVAALKAGAASTAQGGRFGHFLQDHLDRHPLPTREEYLARLIREEYLARLTGESSLSMRSTPSLVRREINKMLKKQLREREKPRAANGA